VVSDRDGNKFSVRGLRSFLKSQGLDTNGSSLLEQARQVLLWAESQNCGQKKLLRHTLIRGAINGNELTGRLDQMLKAYKQQTLDYGRHSRYGDEWKISCYLVVLEKWKPKILPHPPMVDCLSDIMNQCVRVYEKWYSDRFSQPKVRASVMNCFLTRYSASDARESQLKKHIDGANVDGSVILACPTHDPYEGGALKVWDKRRFLPSKKHDEKEDSVYLYDDLRPGDVILLGARLWHQALPITRGTRFALVLFLRLQYDK